MNVHIFIGATAYMLETREMFVLLFGQGLWFGNRMDKSLINSHQCRSYGIQLCDDPTDTNQRLGIHPVEDCFIELQIYRSTCGFLTKYPTNDNLASYRHITMLDEEYRDIYIINAGGIIVNIS